MTTQQDIEICNSTETSRPTTTVEKKSTCASNLAVKLWIYLLNLNLFASISPTTDEFELRIERKSTKVFITLFVVSLTVLIVYTSMIDVTETISIKNPGFNEYQRLYQDHHQSLTCPCQQISIGYDSIIRINYTLHEVCNSVYVSNQWLFFLQLSILGAPTIDDFRSTSLNFFRALRSFCKLVDESISTSMLQLYANSYVSLSVTPLELFQSEFQAIIRQVITSTANNFLLSLGLIRDTTQANFLFSSLMTNYIFVVNSELTNSVGKDRVYDNECDCSVSVACTTNSVIYGNNSVSSSWLVPGFYIGCYVIESFRHSNLNCLYNQTCLNELLLHIKSEGTLRPTVLNSAMLKKFMTNTSLGAILDELMVEEWGWSINYESYFRLCQSSQCSYVLIKKRSWIYTITTIVGLIGGLITALKLIAPWLVSLFIRRLQPRRSEAIERMIRRVTSIFVRKIRDFNLFPSVPPSTDQYDLQTQKMSTRLFMVLFALSITILVIYSSAVKVVKTITVEHPDFNRYQQLYHDYHSTLTCPCKQIAVNYKTFIQINYTLHEVCNSIFVSEQWILYLRAADANTLYYTDFRKLARQSFQALRSICSFIEEFISINLLQFYTTSYVRASVTPKELFQSQSEAFVKEFIESITSSFLFSLRTIRDTTQANAILSALESNYGSFDDPATLFITFYYKRYDEFCDCIFSSACVTSAAIYPIGNISNGWYMPGFYSGCFALEALRLSNLICFYNETCLAEMLFRIRSTLKINVTALSPTLLGQFSMNTTVGTMFDNLMVAVWNRSILYEQYFVACQSSQCIYTITTRNDVIHIITTVIGLIGGIATALKLMVPHAVSFIRNKMRRIPVLAIQERYQDRLHIVIQKIRDFNLFPSVPPPTGQYDLQTQKISTRLFMVLFALSITILVIYSSTVKVLKTITVEHPDFNRYQQLYHDYHSTLTCPCKQIAVNYKTFIQINYTLHEVCNSIFVSEQWISFLATAFHDVRYYDDFRVSGLNFFQALKSLCTLIEQHIARSLLDFYTTSFVSSAATSVNLLQSQSETFIQQFITSTTSRFSFALRMTADTTEANSLFSAAITNSYLRKVYGSVYATTYYKTYDYGCSCDTTSSCTSKARIFLNASTSSAWFIPGSYIGCYVLESLRRSDLGYLYNQTFLSELLTHLSPTLLINVTSLNESLLNHFMINSTLDTIVDELMVDEWIWSTSYDSYFEACQPSECSYTLTTRNDVIYIVTTIIGLVGGLITVLKLIVPFLVKVIRKWNLHRKVKAAKILPSIKSKY